MKWYQKSIWIIVLLVLFSPVGLYLMWKYANWNRAIKWVTSAVFGIYILFYLMIIAVTIIDPTVLDTEDVKVETKEEIKPEKEATISAKKKGTEEASQNVGKDNTKKTSQEPTYEKIQTWVGNGVTALNHYLITNDSRPTEKQVEKIIIELEKKGCGDYVACDYFVWDSKQGYDDRQKTWGYPANETAAANKKHLAGYLNAGYIFYYYGVSGDEPGKVKLYDNDTSKFTIF